MGFSSKCLASTSEPLIEYNERGIKYFLIIRMEKGFLSSTIHYKENHRKPSEMCISCDLNQLK